MNFPYLLRPDQLQALSLLRHQNHLIYIAATGSGKSAVFQKYCFDHPDTRALFISPLRALSRQQAERFEHLGMKTYQDHFPSEESGIWIMSPEKLQGRVMEGIRHWKPDFLIVDEAHCVWEWGREFRPHYRKVLELMDLPSIEKSIWCSATLPQTYRTELQKNFIQRKGEAAAEWGEFRFSPMIQLCVERIPSERKLAWLGNVLGFHESQSGVIFCNTRTAAEKLQRYLSGRGVVSFFYHAGLSAEEKRAHEQNLQESVKTKTAVVIIATSAFGMGMDYSFLKFCILFEPSFTLLSLVQAVGRVGRGGEKTKAYVLWCESDFTRNQAWVDQTEVYHWCRTQENRIEYLENYFNGSVFSGRIKERTHERTDHYSNRTTGFN